MVTKPFVMVFNKRALFIKFRSGMSICLTLPIEDVYKDIVFAEPKIREVKGLRLLE